MTSPRPHDLRISGGQVVSSFTGERFAADVLVRSDLISGVLPPGTPADAREHLDATGLLIAPGFVDAHMHIESSFLTPQTFAALTLARGTTTVLADPHEIVNVAGAAAMRWMIDAGATTAQTQLWGVPSCVPALEGLEHAGARLTADDIDEMLGWPGVIALGEVMDYRAVVGDDPRMREVVGVARRRGMILDGHCPNLSGADLSAYLATGVDSDHTKNRTEVVLEKARLGMLMMLQEKCLLPEVAQALLALPQLPPFCLVTDDLAADHILVHGHLDHIARVAVRAGLPAEAVLRALTWNPAQRLRLYDRGVVAPGKRADLVLLRGELAAFDPAVVLAGGRIVARDAVAVAETAGPGTSAAGTDALTDTVHVEPQDADGFRWRTDLPDGTHRFRALRLNPRDTYTEEDALDLPVRDGEVDWEGRATVVRVRNRYGRAGTVFAPLLGRTLTDGALATTYAHDSHNLVTLGTSRTAMAAAAREVVASGGGVAVAHGDRVVASLPLPVGGVMSPAPADETVRRSQAVRDALDAWGWDHLNPFMSVSTLTLAVSPSLKITDRSLVDVVRRAPVGPLADGA
ncbi:adenine deaminase C-terminal domain-containing protein [Streptomyces benahoarensis]|uniref:Adenine deaminase n=1 Tax=Streptomyces benahoarensis TaxID=2595054 RepID=A0A553YBW0_9ACTN|nr:adenine deaminase C-terminal domain-containing protein [Streptomyces benahoarensis]TSB26694.1 adenine deaminase [Streptomyces benahoarensis]TSB30432.1 adenine deaminase [Streptomyces benahoarensis]